MSSPLSRVVITGASGFVGSALRTRSSSSIDALSLGASNWEARIAAANLEGATIFHLAGRAHAFDGDESAFHRDNADKTGALAQAAVREGARRIVFLSTLKVYGEQSGARPFAPEDPTAPEDAYARSKLAAEEALTQVAHESALEVTIVRSPLVYGPGARANLATLLRLADSPWPLPFASLTAPRSFVHVDDLARLLVAAAESPAAKGKTYIAAHRQGATTGRVVASMRRQLGRPERLWPMSPAMLEGLSTVIGQRARALRLTRPLLGDPAAAERELGWSARVSIDDAVEELVRDYRARNQP